MSKNGDNCNLMVLQPCASQPFDVTSVTWKWNSALVCTLETDGTNKRLLYVSQLLEE